MTHAAMSRQARARAGISDRLVRFSIGLEHEEDLARDIFGALGKVSSAGENLSLVIPESTKCLSGTHGRCG